MELSRNLKSMGGKRSNHHRIVGFDIDGVLTDEFASGENVWQREIEAYFPGIELLEPDFSFSVAYGLASNSVDEFMEACAARIFSEVKPQKGCRQVVDALATEGFTVHLVTARDECHADTTKKWLEKHQLRYDGLWFEENKGALCRELGIEVFVDDHWENCLDIAGQGIASLLMSAPHNLSCPSRPGVYRVENWHEISGFITKYYGLDTKLLPRTAGA